ENIALPKDADEIEKIKYTISQSILNYQFETNKPLTVIAEEIALADITEKKVYDICRDCRENILPLLLGDMVYSLKKQESLPTKIPNIYQALEEHQMLAHH
ncbi:9752_t:CDS:2, partial [Ambispora leptoticha]